MKIASLKIAATAFDAALSGADSAMSALPRSDAGLRFFVDERRRHAAQWLHA
jgi:hypothetical protein